MLCMWQNYKKWEHKIYGANDFHEFLNNSVITETKTSRKCVYLNAPCGFDIETTSTYDTQGNKVAFMYIWTLGLNGHIIQGRTWQEFVTICEQIQQFYFLTDKKHIIIYVHNLAFEFQFMRKYFQWQKVFAVNDRTPVYAITTSGIEFRCSYILSGYSLLNVGKNLLKYPCQKMVGDLDYSLVRHSKTPITQTENTYNINDVAIVMCYVAEEIEKNQNDITKIPLTKTGYVRQYCREACLTDKTRYKTKWKKYRQLMNNLIVDQNEYRQLKRGFQGGFTHASALHSCKTLSNVGSYDFTSSYPYVMISEKFPMSRGKIVEPKNNSELNHYLKCYCCLFDVKFENIISKFKPEHYISSSKCYNIVNAEIDNGRIAAADSLITTITEQDFFIIKSCYTWDSMVISNFRIYEKQYLPTDFVKAILKLYQDKTELKGVQGKEAEYMAAKENVNGCYGMTVTDICQDLITYTEDWEKELTDVEKAISDYNKNKKRFLFYPWGVWVTAYARKNLWSGIFEFKEDYIYSDTDSIKGINIEKHTQYIEKYNRLVKRKLKAACMFHGIDVEQTQPKTITGIEKPLGVWDFEGIYNRFKTLGAKRYMVEKNGDIDITVSGVNKKCAVPYLKQKYGDKVFDSFADNLEIPPQYTGKKTHTYIDDEMSGYITDYLGNISKYESKSGVHLSETSYRLSMSHAYIDYILNIQNIKSAY